MIRWRHLAASIHYCPLCDKRRPFVKLDNNEISVRCLSCHATSITLSVIAVLRHLSPDLQNKTVYELSSRGRLHQFLGSQCKALTGSEYFADTTPGNYKNGVQCQDVQSLTHGSESFDICTSTEVFEHVPDDAKGFREIYRVLKPNGVFVFTVPLCINEKTVERARLLANGDIEHMLEPEYHIDPIRSHNSILAFRNYGYDIMDRLLSAGFKRAELRSPRQSMPWGFSSAVVVAYRDDTHQKEVRPDPLIIATINSKNEAKRLS